MKAKIIDVDIPNSNDRIYPRIVVENAFKKYKEDMIDNGRAIIFSKKENNLDYAYGLVKDIYIEGSSGYVDITPLTHKDNSELTKLIEDKQIHVVTSGIGGIKEGVIQEDFLLDYLFLDPEPSYNL